MSAQAIRAVLKPMWNALSEAAKQKWKEDAPMVKARGKRKKVPPPDAETKAKYEACRARVELPSHLQRAANDSATAGSKRSTPTRRTPRTSKRSSCATRRPSRPSSRSSGSFSGTAARGGALLRSRETRRRYERETPPPARRDDVRVPFGNKTHFTRRGRGRAAARFTPDIAAGTWPDKKRRTRSSASV